MADEKMPLPAHLEELRRRLIVCCVAVAAGFGVCYAFSERLFGILAAPLQGELPAGSTLQYIGVAEAFVAYLKTSAVAGVFLAMPVILYEAWKFVAPGLYKRERRHAAPFVISATLFFLSGAAFCYFVVFPLAFRFLLGFSSGTLQAMPTLDNTLAFSLRMMLAFGLVFEMPVVFFFLGRIGVVHHRWLARKRRHAIVLIFLAAAVLTPGPDALSQLLLAGPLLILFELSIQVVRLTGTRKEDETGRPGREPG